MDRRRALERVRRNRPFLSDFFWFSSAYDYRFLRTAFNLPLGIAIGYLIWLLSFSKLNVVDWNESYTQMLKWTLVACLGMSFAVSPVGEIFFFFIEEFLVEIYCTALLPYCTCVGIPMRVGDRGFERAVATRTDDFDRVRSGGGHGRTDSTHCRQL